MFILRSVGERDLDDLYELSQLVLFINLPPDKAIIQSKIKKSLAAFKRPSLNLADNYYIFVMEDLAKKKVIGVSMIHAQHGTEEEPHYFLTVGQENKFSESLNTGFIHGTLMLGYDTNGPTEIGGLVLHPDYRRFTTSNDDDPALPPASGLGKQLSFVRFLYMALFPKLFKKTIHSELMPPLDSKGNSPLWEAVGRKFMNMDYQDADRLSRSNKEFIMSLFPNSTIYESLLPAEARNAIGKVGEDTKPVQRMLESIGFKYTHEVDPFDGGPHYKAQMKDIKPIREKVSLPVGPPRYFEPKKSKNALIYSKSKAAAQSFDFVAFHSRAHHDNDYIFLPEDIIAQHKLGENEKLVMIYLDW